MTSAGGRGAAPNRYYPGQLSLLPSVGREENTGHRAVMLYGWGVKAG